MEGGKIWRNPEADLPADFDDNRDAQLEPAALDCGTSFPWKRRAGC
ncbi:hypothetical protein IL992_25205 [Microbispora sp. NEAU-D428]|nr:hypothetical protein [Microbispora sitophila]